MFYSSASFSPCRQYRYSLTRLFVAGAKLDRCVAFVGLNPSTADEQADDPTIRRCVRFAKSWNYQGMVMLNLFGWRSTDPSVLKSISDPVGPSNDAAILDIAAAVDRVVLCWGNHGTLHDRGKLVRAMLGRVRTPKYAFKLTAAGEPIHPLYQRADTEILRL